MAYGCLRTSFNKISIKVRCVLYSRIHSKFRRHHGRHFISDPMCEYTGLIPGLCPANERRRYKVTPSLIGWTQPCNKHCPIPSLHGTTASDYSIVAGSTTRNPHSATAQKRDVAVIIAHSNYENVSHSNDIALLKLSSPLTLNDAVRTICVCDSDSAVGTTCTASGFGDVDPGTDRM